MKCFWHTEHFGSKYSKTEITAIAFDNPLRFLSDFVSTSLIKLVSRLILNITSTWSYCMHKTLDTLGEFLRPSVEPKRISAPLPMLFFN